MIVQSPASDAFRTFIANNERFWTERLRLLPPSGNGYVLVDLLHNNGTVLLLNLLLARYIAEFLQLDVAAFVAPTFTGHPVPIEEVEALARSFGVTNISFVDAGDGKARKDKGPILRNLEALLASTCRRLELSMLRRRLRRLNGSTLRRAILDIHMAGVPVGDLIYDSYIDVARQATIDDYDEALDRTLARTMRICGDLEQILKRNNIRALIVSHPVYIDYGLPLRLCLKRNIPVFGKVWLDPIGVRRYERLEEATEFTGMPVAQALDYFRLKLGSKLTERADQYFPPAPRKQMSLDYFRFGYGEDKTEYTKEELVALLGIDPCKTTCLVMAQQFTDSPHVYPNMIFDDYFQWLEETLAFAAGQPHINWLVRQHPYEIMVGETEFFEIIAQRHLQKCDHIKLVPNRVTTSSLFNCVDVVTTVIGSGGIEFASVGIPCILAGNPFYGDFDFVIRPATKEAYFATLATARQSDRLSAQQIMAAKELALVYLSYKRVSSDRVPFISDLAGRNISQDDLNSYWRDATARLGRRVEDDPLYVNVKKMIEEGHQTLLNFGVE